MGVTIFDRIEVAPDEADIAQWSESPEIPASDDLTGEGEGVRERGGGELPIHLEEFAHFVAIGEAEGPANGGEFELEQGIVAVDLEKTLEGGGIGGAVGARVEAGGSTEAGEIAGGTEIAEQRLRMLNREGIEWPRTLSQSIHFVERCERNANRTGSARNRR
jgi:hypothetical protein